MKALKYNSYGGQEKMYWADVQLPEPTGKQLLVTIKAVSINPIDWKIRNGEMKMMIDKKFPKGMGIDFSGIVENMGREVTRFKIGDEVFGWLPYKMAGSVAEFALTDESLTVKKPVNLSFAAAATLPMACIASITALVDNGKIKKGMNVLINGCTGGVGQFAVMIAKNFSANVTGTCGPSTIDKAKQLGVDKVIDYSKNNILNCNQKFDLIFDTAGNLSFSKSKKIMSDNCVFLELNVKLPHLLFGGIKNLFSRKKIKSIIAKASTDKLEIIAKRAEQGHLKPFIGKQYEFENAIEAYDALENGELNFGKTVIIN